MLKKFLARLAERKRERDRRERQARVQRSLGLEYLEHRLTPAPVPVFKPPVEWRGAQMGGTNAWNQGETWVQKAAPQAGQVAYFNLPGAEPYLTGVVTIGQLTVRGGGNGDKLPATPYMTDLDLKGNTLEATSLLEVLSAAGTRIGNTPAAISAGAAPGAILSVDTSAGASTLKTGMVTVGYAGSTILKAGNPADEQNGAILTIGQNVTLQVVKGTTPGDVIVGGATVGNLNVQGKVTARNLSVGGVGSPGAGSPTTGATISGTVALSGSLTVGAQNGYTGKAERPDESGWKYVPDSNVVIDGATVTAGMGGNAAVTSVQIGDYTAGSVSVSSATLKAVGKFNVGSATVATGTGTLSVGAVGVVKVGGVFTINTNGTTTLGSGSILDLAVDGINLGVFQEEQGGELIDRAGKVINKGKIEVASTKAAPTGDIVVQGDFTQQAAGNLVLNIAGNQVGQSYDRLSVSNLTDAPGGGNVTLGGTLDVSSTYTPTPWLIGHAAGDYFTVVSASQSLTGQFDPLTGLNLPDPSTFASLPALPPGYGYQWHVIYDTTDSFDSNLAASDSAISSQPWVGNGTRDVVLVLEEAPLRPNLAVTSASAVGTDIVTVGYNVQNLPVTQAFAVSLFTSQNGYTPDTPNTPFATVTVPGAALGPQTAIIAFAGQTLPAGEQLIAVVDSGNAVAESSEYDNALVLGQFQASDESAPASDPVFAYTLTLASPSDVPVTVNYQTADGTAVAGTDYTAVSGSVTFAPGQTQAEIDVPLLSASGSSGKTFLLHFSSPADGYFVDASGQVVAQADAHLTLTAPAPSGTVIGYAWQDDNHNGIWDQNESGLANVLVNLTEPGGTILSTTTDINGYYSFTGLAAGTYGLATGAPAGTLLEGYYQGGSPAASASVTLTGTQAAAELDAAFVAGATTSTSLTSSNPTPYVGQSVTFTASVAATGGSGTPTGTVDFYDGNTWLGSGTLVAGGMGAQATFATASLALGSHSITAVYAGDANYSGSGSPAVTETVQQVSPAQATISLSSSSQTVMAGMSLSFTATVSPPPNGAAPTGSVTFYDGAAALGTVALSSYMGTSMQAVFTTTGLAVGTHSVTAVYSGDGTYGALTSPAVSVTVQKSSVMVMESSSNSSAAYGTAVTFTATVSGSSPSVPPTGTVSFYDGTTLLATINLAYFNSSYQAAFTISSLSRGSHTIQAVYSGDANYSSSSTSLTESIF